MAFLRTSMRFIRSIKSVRGIQWTACGEKTSPGLTPTTRYLWSACRQGNRTITVKPSVKEATFVENIWSRPTHRKLWGWLNSIFNRVDESRIKEVGPDRACAEWLLRCGAMVKWQERESFLKDYNSLPVSGGRTLKIEEIDATDSAIMHIGFPHFRGCKHIRRIVFNKSHYLDDLGMEQLSLLQESLRELQVSSCGNVSIDGLRHIKKLKNLEYLLLYDLPEIRDKEPILKELEEALPNCAVVFPYAHPKDDPNLKSHEGKE